MAHEQHAHESDIDACESAPEIEIIDIYDADRRPTGLTTERSSAFMQEGQYMLYVLAILENRDGKVLITRRSLDKKWAAGWWEVSGGGARSGEDSFTALRREVREETGLAVDEQPFAPIHTYYNVDLPHGDNYFVDIYHCRLDFSEADVELQESEAIDFKLASWEEIAGLAEQGVFLHYRRLLDALDAERASKAR